jgi:hypothetical protein
MLFGRLKSPKKNLPRKQKLDQRASHTIRVFLAYEIKTKHNLTGSDFGFVRRNSNSYL